MTLPTFLTPLPPASLLRGLTSAGRWGKIDPNTNFFISGRILTYDILFFSTQGE